MKKITACFLVIVLCLFTLSACSGQNSDVPSEDGSSEKECAFLGSYIDVSDMGYTLQITEEDGTVQVNLSVPDEGDFQGEGTCEGDKLTATLSNEKIESPIIVEIVPAESGDDLITLTVTDAKEGIQTGESFTFMPGEPAVQESMDWVGRWYDLTSQRATMSIIPNEENGKYKVEITWSSSAATLSAWRMDADYDAKQKTLSYKNGWMGELTYAEDGSVASEETKWEDAEGSFTLNEDGHLLWTDSKEESAKDFVLERYTAPGPSKENFVEEYFHVIGGYGQGTSGSSLAEAKAACEAYRFASDYEIWNTDIPAMRDTMLAAWESMSEEEQAAFDANFIDVVKLLDLVLSDYEGNAGVFEDAGVGEEMKALLDRDFSALSWSTLCANTLTMGNSED